MSFFQSEQVQENLNDIFNTYQRISALTANVSSMPLEDRLNHIESCKELIDKQKTFYFRLSLASKTDPEALDMKERIAALTQAFGFKDLDECMDQMISTLEQAAEKELDKD
jgi:outer membrane protein assembly factor BamA|tara:strand:+ start:5349 stop:5681 length:333 start_codon:yes stop_codon:yes gene_type:complete